MLLMFWSTRMRIQWCRYNKRGIQIEISNNIMYLNISKPILSDQTTNSLIFTKIYSVQELNDFKVCVILFNVVYAKTTAWSRLNKKVPFMYLYMVNINNIADPRIVSSSNSSTAVLTVTIWDSWWRLQKVKEKKI